MAESLYPNITLHRVESTNITDSFTQRKQEFLLRMSAELGLHSVESVDYTDRFIEKFQHEIENTPPARFADVNVDNEELVTLVMSIVKSS